LRNCKIIIPAMLAGITCFTACWDAVTLPEEDVIESRFLEDTLSQTLENGVLIEFLDSRKSYSLDEEIDLRMRVVNTTDDTLDYRYFFAPPLVRMFIEDEFGNETRNLSSNILFRGEDSLAPGDSLLDGYQWAQDIPMFDGSFYSFKVYAGWYRVESYFNIRLGSEFLIQYPLVRWINIREVGDPLSMQIRHINRMSDSLQIDISLRNRFSESQSNRFAETNAIQLICIDRFTEEALFSVRLNKNEKNLNLPAFSDSSIFTFTQSLSDSILNQIPRLYDLKVRLLFENREELIDSTYIFIP
ncbi:MAG: hypothetical protein AAFP70_10105, partial [Calditrichota bacterium]